MKATSAQGVSSHVLALLKNAGNANYNCKAIMTCLMLFCLKIIYQTYMTMTFFFSKEWCYDLASLKLVQK